MSACKLNHHIAAYIEQVESGEIQACEEQKLLVKMVKRAFETEDIYTDDEQLENYLGLAKYFPFGGLYPWEKFLTGLILCTYCRKDGMPRWPDLFALSGRGTGKDGFIAFLAMCAVSEYNGIKHYDVDICANNKEQAVRPVQDLIEALETPKYVRKLKRFFHWTLERVKSRTTCGVVKGHTNNPAGRDGLRSGFVIFNEIHEYKDYKNIDVFTTGLGKKPHPRRAWFTTDGNVRGGPLDDYKETAEEILRQGEPDNGMLPFICKLDSAEEVHDERNWEKANPSLPYNDDLRREIKKEYREWKKNPEQLPAFMEKRMNFPTGRSDLQVADYEKIKKTNKPLPDLSGWGCTVGIDYASLRDFASVIFHFRKGEKRFDIHHSWFNANSIDRPRIKAPLESWADPANWKDEWNGEPHLTIVEDIEIRASEIVQYIHKTAQKGNFHIVEIALDKFRYDLLRSELAKIGFDATEHKNVRLIRPSDIMAVQPVIVSCFDNELFYWGDDPALRWATNNTKLVRRGKDDGVDTGNFYFAKIEGRSRKTDPFMSLVAAMTGEKKLENEVQVSETSMGVISA